MFGGGEITSQVPVQPGELLAGKYEVERILGAGGMGIVVQAMHVDLQQRVAVKFMLRTVAENRDSVARFLREARAAARLRSDHVARVMDVGRLETGEPYLVMEYLDGVNLASVLAQVSTFSLPNAVDWLLQACEAIAEAHASGIVHRDLKPSNLFVTWQPDGTALVKVLDFGVSKLLKSSKVKGDSFTLTSSLAILGSPAYMSPEQLRNSKRVDHRSDIWSLGIILFELLTGEHPFVSDSLPGLIVAVTNDPTPSVRRLRHDIPAEVDYLIERALEKDPDLRLPNIAEFVSALAPFGSDDARSSARSVVRVLRAAGMTQQASTVPPALRDAPALASLFDSFDTTQTRVAPPKTDTPRRIRDDSGAARTDSPIQVTAARHAKKKPLMVAGGITLVALSFFLAFKLTYQTHKPVPTDADSVQSLNNPATHSLPPVTGVASRHASIPAAIVPEGLHRPPSEPHAPTAQANAKPGFLNLVCVPACTEVRVDGLDLGPSPLINVPVPEGQRHVVAVLPSGVFQFLDVAVREGETTSHRIVFEATRKASEPRAVSSNQPEEPPADAATDPDVPFPENPDFYLPENPF